MNKNINPHHTNNSLQFFCQPSISLEKLLLRDEIKSYASDLAKKNVINRINKSK